MRIACGCLRYYHDADEMFTLGLTFAWASARADRDVCFTPDSGQRTLGFETKEAALTWAASLP